MKINYKNEDYKSGTFSIIFLLVIIIFFVIWWLNTTGFKFDDLGFDIFGIIILLMLTIPEILMIKKYKKQRQKRNLNLFIIKNGICYEGKITSIKYNCDVVSSGNRNLAFHDVVANVESEINGNIKTFIENGILLKEKEISGYLNKIVKVYIYNNLYYIDILS